LTKQDNQWKLFFGAGFVVEPSKGLDGGEVKKRLQGSAVEVDTLPKEFFLPLFESADELPIEIVFVPERGKQKNEVRDWVRSILFDEKPKKEDAARKLALRLALATDQRSPEGLFVTLAGRKGVAYRIALWKFPADQTLQADVAKGMITIRLIEDAFSRESTYFKAAMLEGPKAETTFWTGRIEDRQAKHGVKGAAEFWTGDFLAARPVLTDAHGTRVVAKALRKIIDKTGALETREGLIAAAQVLRTQGGNRISIGDVAARYLPADERDEFIAAAGGPEVSDHPFRLEPEVLESELRLKSITLDVKFVIRGPLEDFDSVVSVTPAEEEGTVQVSLKGKITSESVSQR